MKWAILNNKRIIASPKSEAFCPLCSAGVISKCGQIKVWHWAHKSDFECDSFGEPETKWHLDWKDMFEKELQEVIIKEHRADIKNKKGLVLEFQNSPLTLEKITERERFYKNMVWILNGDTIANNFGLINKNTGLYGFRYDKRTKNPKFSWKWFPKSWFFAEKPVYIDISSWDRDILFQILELSKDGEGIGRKISKKSFVIEHGGKPWIEREVEHGKV